MSGAIPIRAAFYRGGTSKAVVFNAADLPTGQHIRDRLFLHVLGSPDPYCRQLDGMGGGLSSLSKVVIVAPSRHPEADVDYTFVQIAVDAPVADYVSTCGNMSSAIGPFALRERLVKADGDRATVRILNTNTNKIYLATFSVKDGAAIEDGDFEIPGVSGSGAMVELNFLDPGGASTGSLLPTGSPLTTHTVEGVGDVPLSFVDAANPVAFVKASDLDCTGAEDPMDLDANSDVMAKLDAIRRVAGGAAGLADTPGDVPMSNPKVALVAPPAPFTALDGRHYAAEDADVSVRLISMGNTHRAITLPGGMCTAVAAQIPGTLIHAIVANRHSKNEQDDNKVLRIANPSGVLPVAAEVQQSGNGPHAVSATTFRTQRLIMEGSVMVPANLVGDAA
ncbi:MAG: 2-methylaconitate cis-trans isomerase PrpF family protein [Cohaesibacteraceae bacterium]